LWGRKQLQSLIGRLSYDIGLIIGGFGARQMRGQWHKVWGMGQGDNHGQGLVAGM